MGNKSNREGRGGKEKRKVRERKGEKKIVPAHGKSTLSHRGSSPFLQVENGGNGVSQEERSKESEKSRHQITMCRRGRGEDLGLYWDPVEERL